MRHLTTSQKVLARLAALEDDLRVLTPPEKKALKEAIRLAQKLDYPRDLVVSLSEALSKNLPDEEFYNRWMYLMEVVELSISDLNQQMTMGRFQLSSNQEELAALEAEFAAKKSELMTQNREILKQEAELKKEAKLEHRLHKLLGVIDELDDPLLTSKPYKG